MSEQSSNTNRTAECPPLDPELAPLVEGIAAQVPKVTADTLPQLRAFGDSLMPEDLSLGGTVNIREEDIPGPTGAPEVTLTILSPTKAEGTLPVLYYIHGGGLVMGNRYQYLQDFAQFASDGEAVVVSVEYRLAPEHPAPAQLDDSYAGLEWVATHAAELGADPNHIVVAGVSAGGGIALGLTLAARDRGGPAIAGLALIAPMLDDRFEQPSSLMVKDLPTGGEEVEFMWRSALGDAAGGPDVSPYVVPTRAESYAGLPRTYLDVGGVEGFRDEVLDEAKRMAQDGVAVDMHLWAGGSHGFYFMAPDAAISRTALAARDAFILQALRG